MARYDFGVEKRIYVPNLEEADVNSVVKELIEQAQEVNAAIPNKFWSLLSFQSCLNHRKDNTKMIQRV